MTSSTGSAWAMRPIVALRFPVMISCVDWTRVLEVFTGVVLIVLAFYDVFKSVVLPRPAINKFVFVRQVFIFTWRLWLWVGDHIDEAGRKEGWLATFAPIGVLLMFVVWAIAFVLGYGFIIDGFRDEMHPVPADFWESLYFSAGTLVPLSYGDFVPDGLFARLFTIAESATGVALAALAITLLFSLYESFQRREELVVTLDALAGAPPSGVQILETSAELTMRGELVKTFDDWRAWTAAVLESHLAYPVLFYFRSSHDNEAWLNSFGAVMDAANLVVSTVDGEAKGSARLTLTVGNHLVEDMSWNFAFDKVDEVGVEKEEFAAAVERLQRAGYTCRPLDESWERFSKIRRKYAYALNIAARRFAIIPAQWIGDRSYIPHQGRRRPRAG
jgi:nitrate reductase NapE component